MPDSPNFFTGLLNRVVDTASGIVIARNTPAPAPTDAPKIVAPPSALPPPTPAATAPLFPFPPVVWVILGVGLVGGAVYALRRK